MARLESTSRKIDSIPDISSFAGHMKDDLARSLSEMRDSISKMQCENSIAGAEIKNEASGLRAATERLRENTEKLEEALTSGTKVQGLWGEAVLANILSDSGLRKGIDYELQSSDGSSARPDALVRDPGGRILVIDSKTSLSSYLKATREKDPALRKKYIQEHVKSVRRHIDELKGKDYPAVLKKANPMKQYIRDVVMFVPSEGAHLAALGDDPSIIPYAADCGVILATPATLFSLLKLTALAWQEENAGRNQELVIEKAQLLLKRIDSSLAELEQMGDAIEKLASSYQRFMGLVGKRDGAQSIVKPAEDLVKLGVKLGKYKSSLQHSSSIG